MKDDIVVYFQFDKQCDNILYTFNASTCSMSMLKGIYNESNKCKFIDHSEAREEYESFSPPYGMTIDELSFNILLVKGAPTLKNTLKNELALYELQSIVNGIQHYNDLFCKVYHYSDDAISALNKINTTLNF